MPADRRQLIEREPVALLIDSRVSAALPMTRPVNVAELYCKMVSSAAK